MTGLDADDCRKKILRDRYKILRRLGKKAGRQTLLARDLNTQDLVVIKLLTFSSDFNWDDLKLFERETATLQSLNYPAIPRYLDSFEFQTSSGKSFAMVQSYIEAQSLEEHLKAGRIFNEDETKQLARTLLEILIYLHGQKPPVIHRDIKPSNILLKNRSGNSVGQVYLVDFGSVQTLATQEGKTVTVVGTYGYMPPEQFGGRAVPASDLYSVGATLIALATRKHPADLPQKDMRIQFEQAVHLSPAFTSWLKWMTEPSLERRLASAEPALQALEQPWRGDSEPLLLQQKNPVTTAQLLWNALWRSTAMGTVIGLAYGVMYGRIVNAVGIVSVAVIQGGIAGMTFGLSNGLLVGILTRIRFFPLTNAPRYRQTVNRVSTLLYTIISSSYSVLCLVVFYINSLYYPSVNSINIIVPYTLKILSYVVFTLFAVGLPMGLISQRIARWYEKESKPEKKDRSFH